MKKPALIIALILISANLFADEKVAGTNITVDSTYVVKYKKINDYSTIGIQYGVNMSSASVQPERSMSNVFTPMNLGITYTSYGKLFGYMPYFGVQVGAFITQEAFRFKKKENGGYSYYMLGAAKREMTVLEVPALALFHFDFWKLRLMLDVGVFGGYRFNVHRSEYVSESQHQQFSEYENTFHPKEIRWDYGIKAGGGFAILLDPVEIHITAQYKYSWSNVHQPDTDYKYDESKYYYNWTYPTNIVISLGVHYQITRRVGRTKKDLRTEARETVNRMLEETRLREEERMRSEDVVEEKSDDVTETGKESNGTNSETDKDGSTENNG